MKILLTGGGSGGHFYPILAVIRALKRIAEEEKFIEMRLIYLSDSPFDPQILKGEGVEFVPISSGKMRRYFSLLNFTDLFKTAWGILRALIYVFTQMPDVVFSKGGYASFPALFSAKLFGIPVVIHESDVVPGKVNRWAGKFSKRIAISFPESAKYFSRKSAVALTGNPIRARISGGNLEEAQAVFGYENLPTVLVLGGSQGSAKINNVLLQILPDILKEYRVIHQCGRNNFDDVSGRAGVILQDSPFKKRYLLFPFLDENILRSAAVISNLVVSRAGAGAIFEIAAWRKPSILIPIRNSAQDHQRENAYAYARAGGAMVIEETNLTPHLLLAEIRKLSMDAPRIERMKIAASNFSKTDSAEVLAREIISLALEHAR